MDRLHIEKSAPSSSRTRNSQPRMVDNAIERSRWFAAGASAAPRVLEPPVV